MPHPRVRFLVLAAGLALGGCASAPATPPMSQAQRAALADSLVRLGDDDQRGRAEIGRALTTNDTATLFRSVRADSARSRWLRAVVRAHGWPSRALVGERAAGAAWLVLQHSPLTDFQREMLPTMERLAAEGEVPTQDLAMLTDRVLLSGGQPQRYGSQFAVVDGRLVAKPIADLRGLDARRAAVGLQPIAEYVRDLGEIYELPVVWPPS